MVSEQFRSDKTEVVQGSMPTPCWLWKGQVGGTGYGRVRIGGRMHAVHRVAYELAKGPIPVGLQLDHLCRVRHCCNPSHLEAVTQQENIRRGERMNMTHCKRGHEFTESSAYYTRGVIGLKRQCKACMKISKANRRNKIVCL